MENSSLSTTTATSPVTPPKATLNSVTSKEQPIVIRNHDQLVLNHSYDLDQNINQVSSLHPEDNQQNQLAVYQQSSQLNNFRSQPDGLIEINEHGYSLPLEHQHSSTSLYYGSYDGYDYSTMSSLPHAAGSNISLMPPLPQNTWEINDSLSSLIKSSHELSERNSMTEFKIGQDLFQKAHSNVYHQESPDKTPNQARNLIKRSQTTNENVSIQLPGIETFSSSVPSPLLTSSKMTVSESIPVTISTVAKDSIAINPEIPLMDAKQGYFDPKMPFSIMKDDISFLTSNNIKVPDPGLGKSENYTDAVVSLQNSNMHHSTFVSTLPQYPCLPSPSDCNTLPVLQPHLPINYRPLLENLRPIRRTEEIVRLKNDGGKITIVETTDDPGKSNYIQLRNTITGI